ncbi:MAG: arsenate reductase (glutaredoxin) [Flavobacteriales bacterium]|jgi:arsenate reductase|nr:arsenate reductase (glutaredoxin) [Flavobacteriales bacterium]
MKIYHNPRCSKSRNTLAILEEKGADFSVVKYLDTPPSKKEIEDILKKLGIPAKDLVRKTEDIFKKELKGKEFSVEEWIDWMVKNPKLIERPIVVSGNKAVIGRPPENVLEIL